MNVILAGMPGSGKTRVSKILGELLNAEVLDTDEIIVKEHGAISEIFANYGEEHFRNLETQTVKKVCAYPNAVVSTGGGCLLREENIALLKKSGRIVYLKASLDTLSKRIQDDNSRPLLAGDTKKRLAELLEKRSSIYECSADISIETDNLTPREIAIKITELIK